MRPGVPTIFFDELARKMCRDMGVVPNFLNYCGYPFALCCSVNETIIHGFPSKDIILKEGDIVSFDMGVNYKGFHGDSARTAFCGEVSEEARHLSEVTKRCLELGIAEAHPGNNLYAISAIGTPEGEIMADGWTTKIKDRSLSAHWEHTVAIRPDGAEILSVAENYRP